MVSSGAALCAGCGFPMAVVCCVHRWLLKRNVCVFYWVVAQAVFPLPGG